MCIDIVRETSTHEALQRNASEKGKKNVREADLLVSEHSAGFLLLPLAKSCCEIYVTANLQSVDNYDLMGEPTPSPSVAPSR